MLNILYITPWFPNSPTDDRYTYMLHSIDEIRKAGTTVVTLVTRPWTPGIFGLLSKDWIRPRLNKNNFDPSLNIHEKHFISIPRNYAHGLAGPLYRLGTVNTIKKLIKQYNIHLIHAHTEHVGFVAVPMAKELGLPVCITLHGINTAPRLLNTRRKRENFRKVLDGADRVILVGEPLRAYFAPLAGRDDHFRVVPNGFSLPGSMKTISASQWGPVLKIISVSNLHEGKGIDLNLQALAKLDTAGVREWTYDIVGDGRERASLQNLVADLSLNERVTFHGAQPHNKVFELLKSSDVFLLPSYREAFGIAYLEAMACGLLAIGVRGQGPEAFISHGTTGYLVPPKDSEAINRILQHIRNNKHQSQQVAEAGALYIRERFSWDNHTRKLCSVYGELISNLQIPRVCL